MMTAPRKVTTTEAKSAVGYVSGVTADDDIFTAAEKAITVMRLAFGPNHRSTRNAERLLVAARARHAT